MRTQPRRRFVLALSLAVSFGAVAGCKKKQDKRETDSPPQDSKRADAATATTPPATPPKPLAPTIENATALAKKVIIVDGHIDLPWRLNKKLDKDGVPTIDPGLATEGGDFDHPRAMAGGLDAPFMSIYIPAKFQKEGGAKKKADQLIDLVEGLIKRHPDKFAAAHSPDQVVANHEAGKVSLPMGIENGAAIEDDLANIEHFHRRGVRYMTLTHSKDNLICDSSYATTRTHKGLSEFGRKVVVELNRVGIMVDISHVSDDAFFQAVKLSAVPVIASHSSARHFIPGFERNMSDDMIKTLGKAGGVMMINFGSTFVSKKAHDHNAARKAAIAKLKEESSLEDDDPKIKEFSNEWKKKHPFPFADVSLVADHIDHAVKLAGIDHVGFGSDYDGVGPTLPVGLKDAAAFPSLIRVLLERGYSESDIEKLAGGNVLRVWRAVEAHAAEQAK